MFAVRPPRARHGSRPPRSAGAVGLMALACLAVAQTGAATAPALPPVEGCTSHRAEARYANYGYDHWVFVKNACPARVVCRVSTDVAPTPVEVDVPRSKTAEVLTFRGSPAREFKATVTCRYR